MIAARENDVEVADEETGLACCMPPPPLTSQKMADLGVIDYNPDAPRVESCL